MLGPVLDRVDHAGRRLPRIIAIQGSANGQNTEPLVLINDA
jgi:hypothetical protein